MLARVRRTLRERRLLAPGDHVLVACSGGPDSVALLDVLARLGPELGVTLAAASVDHGLRPEATAEVEAVRRLADRLGLPFHGLRVEVPPGTSVQGAARAARYGALRGLASALGARRIATGHTLDDQAETVLSRLLRGAGITGLSGIAPRRRDGVVRPLIDCSRAEVKAHLGHRGLPFVQDPTNADGRFERARLRHEVLPQLRAENPRLTAHLAHLADEARASRRWARHRAAHLLRRAPDPRVLRSARLRAAPPAVRQAALRQWLAQAGGASPGRAHLEQLERALGGRGEVRLPGGLCVRAEPGRLVLDT